MATIATRVSRGAKLLDVERPDWYKTVDADSLEMESVTYCILGQTFKKSARLSKYENGYDVAMRTLNVDESSYYGFDAGSYSNEAATNREFCALDNAWRRQIGRRYLREGKKLVGSTGHRWSGEWQPAALREKGAESE